MIEFGVIGVGENFGENVERDRVVIARGGEGGLKKIEVGLIFPDGKFSSMACKELGGFSEIFYGSMGGKVLVTGRSGRCGKEDRLNVRDRK